MLDLRVPVAGFPGGARESRVFGVQAQRRATQLPAEKVRVPVGLGFTVYGLGF